VLSYDEILAALSDDPNAARLEIERKRADIETAKLEQRRLMSLGQFRLYLETLDHQTLAWQKGMGRKNGATVNDHKLKGNLEVQLERYRRGLRDDPAFEHKHLLDGRPCVLTSNGMPLGKDLVFVLEADGKTLKYRVESVGFRINDDGKWLKALPLEDEVAFRVFQECDLEHAKPLML
jgi:hypothetical protein